MDSSARIERLVDHYGVSLTEIAKRTGLPPQRLYDIASGKTKSFSDQVSKGITSLFSDLNPLWLLTGDGNMLSTSQPSEDKEVQATPLPYKESYLLAEKLGIEIVPEYSDTFKGGGDGSFITSDTVNAY